MSTIQDTDWFLINRDGTDYKVSAKDLQDISNLNVEGINKVAAVRQSQWCSVAYGEHMRRWVAVSNHATNTTMVSDNQCTSWKDLGRPNAFPRMKCITSGGGKFVAVADNGDQRVMTSEDGKDWTFSTDDAVNAELWQAVIYANGKFAAVSYKSFMTSTDGIDWEIKTIKPNMKDDEHPTSLAYGNGIYVIVGDGGYKGRYSFYTDDDGVTWKEPKVQTESKWTGVVFGNGRFVAVASSGHYRAMTSTDGYDWDRVVTPTSQGFMGVAYGRNHFIAIAFSRPGFFASKDGKNWEVSSEEGNSWKGISFANGRFVIVGSGSYSATAWTYTGYDRGVRTMPTGSLLVGKGDQAYHAEVERWDKMDADYLVVNRGGKAYHVSYDDFIDYIPERKPK